MPRFGTLVVFFLEIAGGARVQAAYEVATTPLIQEGDLNFDAILKSKRTSVHMENLATPPSDWHHLHGNHHRPRSLTATSTS